MSTLSGQHHHAKDVAPGIPDYALFAALLRNLPDSVFIKDRDSRYVVVNPAMVELLGAETPEEIIGRTDDDFLSPDKARISRAEERRLLDDGAESLEKNEFIQGRGRSVWYAITKTPLRDASGRITGLIGIARDISDHVLSEKRERATSHDLKAVVEMADRLIVSQDLDALLRKAVELARTHLRVERCTIMMHHGNHLRGTYGTDLHGRTTDEREKIIPIDPAWENRFRLWEHKSSQWTVERDINRSSPDAREIAARGFWVATTPIKGSHNRLIAVFCNDAVISGAPPDERLQDVIAVYCSLLGNIIERQRGMDELSRRDQVLEAVARAAGQLLILDDLDAAIHESLRVLGESMDVDRVYIFRNHTNPLTGEWLMSQRYEWARLSELREMHNDDMQDLPYQPHFAAMFDTLAGGHVYGGPVTTLSLYERRFMERQAIQSILLVPIHLNNQFWGFIGFDDCRQPREWNHNDKTILMAMAGNLAGAISQELTERELKARDRILSGVARANHELLTRPDLDQAVANALLILANAVNVERVYLCENLLDPAGGQPVMCPRYLYSKHSGVMSQFTGHERSRSYAEHLPGWYNIMSSGKPIQGRLLDFISPPGGGEPAVYSVLVAPLMIDKKFWGLIGFDTPDREHNWSPSDVSTLATMAGSIGGAIARKRAADHLRHSEEHFRSLIENGSDLIIVVNRHGDILYGSPSVERELGYRIAALPRLNWFSVVHPDDRATLGTLFDDAATTLPTGLLRFRVKHFAGDWRHMESAVKRVTDESGADRYIVNARDITQRIKAEDALRRSEELLRHSQKMEAIGRLAGGIAHDFNNLLTAILGYGDLLRQRTPPETEGRHEIDEIYRAAERAHALTRQLLAFSRRQVLEPTRLDLNLAVQEVEKLLSRLIGDQITLRLDTDPAPCPVKVDRGQIEQVIMNLALNARDAMPQGGELVIATRNEHLDAPLTRGMRTIPAGDHVLLTITDTGHGIADKDKHLIFEPFFTTKEVGKGTGLGLSMVYGIVEQSQGLIWFDSQQDVGTTFSIYFPRVDMSDLPDRAPAPHEAVGGHETILLIEDDKIVRELSQRVLQDKGYRVITRENGTLGLDYFTAHADEIDLILTDIIMPQMSGLAVARAARKIKPDLRVLFMSGYAEDQQPESHETGDGRHYIQKPFTLSTLLGKIRDLLDLP